MAGQFEHVSAGKDREKEVKLIIPQQQRAAAGTWVAPAAQTHHSLGGQFMVNSALHGALRAKLQHCREMHNKQQSRTRAALRTLSPRLTTNLAICLMLITYLASSVLGLMILVHRATCWRG